jgi:hypothetical protein
VKARQAASTNAAVFNLVKNMVSRLLRSGPPRALRPADLAGRHVHHRALAGVFNKNRWVGLTSRLKIDHVLFLASTGFFAAAPGRANNDRSEMKGFRLHLTSEAI